MSKLPRPCLDCNALTTHSRCDACSITRNRQWDAARDQSKRQHYTGNYKTRAKKVRAEAVACYWCAQPFTHDNPVQADHVDAGNADSVLVASCRRCNIRRGRGAI